MRAKLMMVAIVVILSAITTGKPAAAYEYCKAKASFEQCMECGARHGWYGRVQEKFCAALPHERSGPSGPTKHQRRS
jgi:hypothetical protein